MSLSKLQDQFISALKDIYDREEAINIWQLAVESITEINLRVNPNPNYKPDGCFIKMISEIQKRLQKHEPIQYILNEAWFYDIPFYVNNKVLIPRPETEELVDWVIKDNNSNKESVILDVGTGSGCIPIILKRKMPLAEIYTCDISPEAIEVAKKNAVKYKTDISFLQLNFLDSNAWAQLPKTDIIVSNPPYIPDSDKINMRDNVLQYEPHVALFVKNESPLIFYEAIANAGAALLNKNGSIYAEVHESQGNQTKEVFEKKGFDAIIKKDAQGKDRFIRAVKTF